ncbi:MAG: D-tyrosyl-tRNA(Tyr) deacylase [Bdellovibrionales bacterium GWB1_52_6]|nr:MAG: D-tyrosyl-tRNA(Tyr) deacylase [Bdellovibrionales bacterium GWB1_52_6]OFZ04921.1 MAG: D-tyrosyl-tRNA(Tyr) deacylase [Bdellovibrionales bacterium GWA1_52_35]HCM38857.1 D-tyrosyl-tRNA(Tyr) deacylase [Bdellovibrionales bacterium]
MRTVIQRVKNAQVVVDGIKIAEIGPGLLTLLGVGQADDEAKIKKIIQKICDLRIFEDENGKMNLSLKDIRGQHLIVSQFTLLGDCGTGRRPSFTAAAAPELAKPLYEYALKMSREYGVETAAGVFQADMQVSLVNDGPVTFVLEN